MLLLSKINKWGNSWGIRIPAAYLKELGLSQSQKVNLVIENGKIIISPAQPTLEEYLSKFKKRQKHQDPWADIIPVGKEIW